MKKGTRRIKGRVNMVGTHTNRVPGVTDNYFGVNGKNRIGTVYFDSTRLPRLKKDVEHGDFVEVVFEDIIVFPVDKPAHNLISIRIID